VQVFEDKFKTPKPLTKKVLHNFFAMMGMPLLQVKAKIIEAPFPDNYMFLPENEDDSDESEVTKVSKVMAATTPSRLINPSRQAGSVSTRIVWQMVRQEGNSNLQRVESS